MKWTNEPPTVEGYYWYRKHRHHGEDRIVLVYGHADYGLMQGKRTVALASRGGKAQWSDVPISEPRRHTEQANTTPMLTSERIDECDWVRAECVALGQQRAADAIWDLLAAIRHFTALPPIVAESMEKYTTNADQVTVANYFHELFQKMASHDHR